MEKREQKNEAQKSCLSVRVQSVTLAQIHNQAGPKPRSSKIRLLISLLLVLSFLEISVQVQYLNRNEELRCFC